MDEKPWITVISISCDNPALRPFYRDIEDELRTIVARAGWDQLGVKHKLEEVIVKLRAIRERTVDMRLPPHKRFK